MREVKARGLCLRAIEYKDNDKLISLYLEGVGKVLAKARGVKKPNAKLRYAATPTCFGDYILTERGGYYTLTGCDLIDAHTPIWGDINKLYYADAVLELLDKLTKEGDIEDELFSLASSELSAIEGEYDLARFALYLMTVISASGFGMDISPVSASAYKLFLIPETGGVSENICLGYGKEISPGVYDDLIRLQEGECVCSSADTIGALLFYIETVMDARIVVIRELIEFLTLQG